LEFLFKLLQPNHALSSFFTMHTRQTHQDAWHRNSFNDKLNNKIKTHYSFFFLSGIDRQKRILRALGRIEQTRSKL